MASTLSVRTRNVRDHACELDCIKTVDTLMDYINSGYLVKFRRKFRCMCLVSETNPESKMFFKSTSQINEEQIRHLKKFYYMIHPFSEVRRIWEGVMINVYLLQMMLLVPLELIFVFKTPMIIYVPKFALDIVSYVDIVMNFYTGYVKRANQVVVLSRREVAKQYLLGSLYINGLFWVDVLSSIPFTIIMYIFDRHDLYFLKVFFFLKLFRIPTLSRFIYHYFLRRNFWTTTLRFVLLLIWFLIGIFWLCAFAVYLMHFTTDNLDLYNKDFFAATYLLVNACTTLVECVMLVGPDPMDLNTPWEKKALVIIFVILGIFVNLIILSQVLSFYQARNAAQNKHQELLQQIDQFSRYKEIPPDLRDKIVTYVDFNYHRKILKEADVLKTLPVFLREEVMLFKCQGIVERVDFFKTLPAKLLLQIVTKLKAEIHLKNEVIFQVGGVANCMYFISVGSVDIFSQNGMKVLTFGEGKHIGDVGVMANTRRTFTAMAASDCELLVLKKTDLMDILLPYPQLIDRLASMALKKYEKLVLMLQELSGGKRQ